MSKPKLYAWQPEGHGPLSFFVMSYSEDEARRAVSEFIAVTDIGTYDQGGWPHSQDWNFTVAEIGEVLINDNS